LIDCELCCMIPDCVAERCCDCWIKDAAREIFDPRAVYCCCSLESAMEYCCKFVVGLAGTRLTLTVRISDTTRSPSIISILTCSPKWSRGLGVCAAGPGCCCTCLELLLS